MDTGNTRRRYESVFDGRAAAKPGAKVTSSAWQKGWTFLLGPRLNKSGTDTLEGTKMRADLATSRGRSSGQKVEGSLDPWMRRYSSSASSESGAPWS